MRGTDETWGRFETWTDLTHYLDREDFSVPSLRKQDNEMPRTARHTERFMMKEMLHHAAALDLDLPVSVRHGDAPDFFLQAGRRRIGVECVEATWTALSKARSLDSFSMRSSAPKELRRDDQLSRADVQAALLRAASFDDGGIDDGWQGDTVEQTFADKVVNFFREKIAKSVSYARNTDEFWLLVYENMELPCLRLDDAADMIRLRLRSLQVPSDFTRIVMISGESLAFLETKGDQAPG